MRYNIKELLGRGIIDGTVIVHTMSVAECWKVKYKLEAYRWWRRRNPIRKLYRLNRWNKFSGFWWNPKTRIITYITILDESAFFKKYHKDRRTRIHSA